MLFPIQDPTLLLHKMEEVLLLVVLTLVPLLLVLVLQELPLTLLLLLLEETLSHPLVLLQLLKALELEAWTDNICSLSRLSPLLSVMMPLFSEAALTTKFLLSEELKTLNLVHANTPQLTAVTTQPSNSPKDSTKSTSTTDLMMALLAIMMMALNFSQSVRNKETDEEDKFMDTTTKESMRLNTPPITSKLKTIGYGSKDTRTELSNSNTKMEASISASISKRRETLVSTTTIAQFLIFSSQALKSITEEKTRDTNSTIKEADVSQAASQENGDLIKQT